ncbi:MAG: carboxy terminal-processing peptidase [Gammaproteobacteria bacterium]
MQTQRRLSLLVFFAAFASAIAAGAAVNTVTESELRPTAAQERATRLVTHFITNYHYKKVPLDDALSTQILNRYLDSIDPGHIFFTAADVEAFGVHRARIDDYLRDATLAPVFDIFKVYRQRVSERVAFAKSVLARPFDFSVEESIEIDRSKAPWPASGAELDELWRKRVKNDVLSLRIAGKDPAAIQKSLLDRYDGLARRTQQLNSEDVYQLFVNAYTTSIEPHTAYFSPRTSENFRIRMSLSLEGIGAVLQADEEYTVVREIVPGGPADKSGRLHPQDRIVGVAQGETGEVTDVIGWRLDDVVDLIRGPKDTVVRLEVLPKGVAPGGPTRTLAITRNKIELEEQAAKKSVIEIGAGPQRMKIGVIEVPTFYLDFEARAAGDPNYRSTTRDVRRLIGELKSDGVSGIVIDLRGDGGGSLSEATELTGLFVGSGPVVQVRSSDGRIQIERSNEPGVVYTGPLAILVDRYSASASEIFAGAIQDYGRGVVIGEPTFGKGTVQNLVDLSRLDRVSNDGLGELKATVAQFFRIAGASTQHRGVVPDIVFPTAQFANDEGERSLDNALPWDQVKPAKFVRVDSRLGPFAHAIAQHDRRIANDEAFKVLLEEARAVQQARDRKSVTLVETRRREEQDRVRRENRERENRLRAAVGLPALKDEPAGAPQADEEETDIDAEERAKDPKYDVVLNETARILGDLIAGPPAVKAAQSTAGPAAARGYGVACAKPPC